MGYASELDFVPKESSFRIISDIIRNLFNPESDRLDREVAEICRQNRFRTRTEDQGIIFNGTTYLPTTVPRRGATKAHLDPALYDRMDLYLKDRDIIAFDLGQCKQILFNLLDPCESFQDMRDALPNCLSETLPELKTLDRVKPEAWTIKDDPRAMRLYEKLLPKLELYSVSKLFF